MAPARGAAPGAAASARGAPPAPPRRRAARPRRAGAAAAAAGAVLLLGCWAAPAGGFAGGLPPRRRPGASAPRAPRPAGAPDALADALERGRRLAVQRGLLPEAPEGEAAAAVRVVLAGAEAEAAAAAVLEGLPAPGEGCVVALQGPPSDEKAAVLRALQRQLPRVETWTVSTFFRAVAFLLMTFSEQTGTSLKDVLQKPEMLAAGIEMIQEMRAGNSIGSMAADAEQMMSMSSDGSKIDENLPLAMEYGQGEVVKFINNALIELRSKDSSMTVLLDGPEEILRYTPTTHRFTLS